MFVAGELSLDGAGGDIPYPDHLVFGTSCKELAIRTEADAADVQITFVWQAAVLQNRDDGSGVDVEDLSRSIAPSSNIFTIPAESYTAHNTLVNKVVDKINIKHPADSRVENGIPITSFTLEMRRYLFRVKFG